MGKRRAFFLKRDDAWTNGDRRNGCSLILPADELAVDIGFDAAVSAVPDLQAAVVEEYLCCSLLDPEAPRTARLRSLLSPHFPVQDLPGTKEVTLPWEDAQIKNICR